MSDEEWVPKIWDKVRCIDDGYIAKTDIKFELDERKHNFLKIGGEYTISSTRSHPDGAGGRQLLFTLLDHGRQVCLSTRFTKPIVDNGEPE